MKNGRGRFDGLLRIVRFNWPYYAAGVGVAIVAIYLSGRHGTVSTFALAATAISTYWIAASLVVSHIVYDRSSLYHWEWLKGLFPQPPQRWAHIHAGFDETSSEIAQLFPMDNPCVIDIHDSERMTESSISRARQASSAAVPASFQDLPLETDSRDAVFLIFAAHELRRAADRTALFKEIARALAPGGRLVLIEHLRDWKNLLAFGPGFLHFFPESEWRSLVHAAGLSIERAEGHTPFVKCFVCVKPGPDSR
jgi:hypothetical protein